MEKSRRENQEGKAGGQVKISRKRRGLLEKNCLSRREKGGEKSSKRPGGTTLIDRGEGQGSWARRAKAIQSDMLFLRKG